MTSSDNYIELKKMGSSAMEHAMKVRKPYTITKQRERWTEEEHNKFLEALKLYGRAWRQIKEHIGSKTAVQIRSHAQKFFTKAVRESEMIEIPPPRPKKRPMRPYPRKLGNFPSIPVMEKFPVSEQDNQSPTSVLSSTSDQMNSCTSPVSSVAGSDPVTMPVDDEDESMPQQTSDMVLFPKSLIQDLGTDDSIPSEVASSVEAPLASLRLFGKTVVVAEPQKPANINTEDSEPAITTGIAKQCINGSVPTLQMGEGSSSEWNPWAITMAPAFYVLPSHGTLASSAGAGVVPMPPWFWAVSGENQGSVRERWDDGSVQKESSSGDSNSVGLTIKNVGGSLKRSETSAFRILKAAPRKDLKGFVPYRRCMAERSNESKGDQ